MKTDKELLELAAKAADMGCEWHNEADCMFWDGMPSMGYWNPLNDDGDAFRLAVKLNLAVDVSDTWVNIFYNNKVLMACPVIVSEKLEITRRAIVRVAAAIGESK